MFSYFQRNKQTNKQTTCKGMNALDSESEPIATYTARWKVGSSISQYIDLSLKDVVIIIADVLPHQEQTEVEISV